MGAQFGNRAEPDGSVRELGLDRSIRIERIGHAVDDARFQDRRRLRLLLGERVTAPIMNMILRRALCRWRRSVIRPLFDWSALGAGLLAAGGLRDPRHRRARTHRNSRAEVSVAPLPLNGTENRGARPLMPRPHRWWILRNCSGLGRRRLGNRRTRLGRPIMRCTIRRQRNAFDICGPPTARREVAPFAGCSSATVRWRQPRPQPLKVLLPGGSTRAAGVGSPRPRVPAD